MRRHDHNEQQELTRMRAYWKSRRCWICDRRGWCIHREPEVARAEAEAARHKRSPAKRSSVATFTAEEKLQEISELPSLQLGKNIFSANLSIDDLAAAQGIKQLKAASELATEMPEEEDGVDEMLEEIYNSRY